LNLDKYPLRPCHFTMSRIPPSRFFACSMFAFMAASFSCDAAWAVRYSDFGAAGNGKTDDFDALVRAHEHANEKGLPVKADDGATYYLGGAAKTIQIMTDTDFGSASFLIDDTNLESHHTNVFELRSAREPMQLKEVDSLRKGQARNYHTRGIGILRSNVIVYGLEHRIKGEGEDGPPYRGFINISKCANVQIRDSIFSGHKTYYKIGSAGKRVPMGSYDLSINQSVNVSLIRCTQFNDRKIPLGLC